MTKTTVDLGGPDSPVGGVQSRAGGAIQPWFFAYGLLGLVQNGAAPILLPLSAGNGAKGGLIYAAWASAGLLAPVLGAWADRHGRHLTLVLGGLLLGAAPLAAFPFAQGAAEHAVLAFLGGLGVIAVSIVGSIFIVGHAPAEQWDEQIGVLQAFVSGGQIAGLLLAGACARLPYVAFGGAAVALLAAWPIAWRFAPRDPASVLRREVRAPAPVGGEAAASGTQRLHHASLRGIVSLGWLPQGGLRRFLGVWLLSYTATNAVSVMFPVALTHEFGAAPILPSAAYAAGILLSLPIYRPAGHWEHRATTWGSPRGLLRAGLLSRAAVLLLLGVLAWLHPSWATWPVLAGFAATQVIWPLLAVSSNTLAVTLAPTDRGESVGLLNACTALGATIGGVAGGLIATDLGFGALCGVACACVLAALATLRTRRSA